MLTLALIVGLSIAAPTLSPEQEREARLIEAMVIAPCCWSQQVSVHQSPAADEIRKDIRVRLARGEARQRILDDYVVQFGTRILAEPPASGFNRLLYVLPPLALVGGAGLVIVFVRRFTSRKDEAAPATAAVAGGARPEYERKLDEELENLD